MDTGCAIDGCPRPKRARDWCIFHYNRWHTYGTPTPDLGRIVGDDDTRFFSKVQKTEDHWLWTGGTFTDQGYPQFSVNRRNLIASRWAYARFVGPIPDGYQVDHVCTNIMCVRPDHLEAVTQAENRRRQSPPERTCDVARCNRPHRCYGMCNMHYLRWKKSGGRHQANATSR